MDKVKEIKTIQNIIKEGCASGRPYPWCPKDTDCSPKACWYQEAKEVYQLFKCPDMVTECKCGHPLEEHDWGAWVEDEASCLVEECTCGNFNEELE